MKARKIITIGVTVIASAMVVFSGIMKLTAGEEVVSAMSKIGIAEYLVPLALMEIGFTALFLYPKTMKIGFILLSCYFAGALATELSHGTPFNALLPIVLVWISAFLRDSSIFLPNTTAQKIF
ncbi:DoxX family protein [Dyadobacter chenwenxiniae]|uniref:DoxX family protein n=1 Tax=Dyadobacter chenwenxiniae TaxID=2906456 RepID=A0A9X1TER7_9BACT|nr:DoxX family protein [Dyadobacter chenwenxiniae]MCF0062322.1 DoxX family protein [Dyadobacter chenwenxiniae]UON83922.1 DoxX family protein [Dyadobacter chenwenxiniae]